MYTSIALVFTLLAACHARAWGPWPTKPYPSGAWPTGYPQPSGEAAAPAKTCLTKADAEQVSKNFFIITGGKGIFNLTVAKAALAEDFHDSSESVASIVDGGGDKPLPLLTSEFNKTSFNAANALQPRTEYKALNLYWNCDTVFQRFEVTNLSPQSPRGISIFETQPAPAGNLYPFQIKQVYGEIDSVAWLVDLNYTITAPPK